MIYFAFFCTSLRSPTFSPTNFKPFRYVVQVFDDGPVAKDGRIHAGDELVSVNGTSCRSMEKSQVAKMIKELPGDLIRLIRMFNSFARSPEIVSQSFAI